METAQYQVYVLQNPRGNLYIGFTTNLDKRLTRHQNNEGGWTRDKGPWSLVYSETYTDRKEAMSRERYLKQGKANQELRRLLAGWASAYKPA